MLGKALPKLRQARLESRPSQIHRTVQILGDLTCAQKARLADVCERTPVTLAVKGGVNIQTMVSVQLPAESTSSSIQREGHAEAPAISRCEDVARPSVIEYPVLAPCRP